VAPNGLLCGHIGHATEAAVIDGEIKLLGEFLPSAVGENFANRLACSPAPVGLSTLCRGDEAGERWAGGGASVDADRGGGEGGEATPVSAEGMSPLAKPG
jgi:hypothetical protein